MTNPTKALGGETTARRLHEILISQERGFTWLSRKTGLTVSQLKYQLRVSPSSLTVETMLKVSHALGVEPHEAVAA